MADTTENDLEQMKKFETLRRLLTAIVLRHVGVSALLFLLAFAFLFTTALKRARYFERFEAVGVLFFRPRTTEHVPPAGKDETVQVLLRYALREKVADRLAGGEASLNFRQTIAGTTDFIVDPRNGSAYYLVARATTAPEAARRATAFADVCLEEYAHYRNADLDVAFKTADDSRNETLKRLKELDDEEDELNRKTDFVQPEHELARLNETVLRQKTALSEANVRLARESSQRRKIESDLAAWPKEFVSGIESVKALLGDLDKARDEVAAAESRYTEKNPKLIVAREQFAALKARFQEIARRYGIQTLDQLTVDKIMDMVKELSTLKTQVDLAQETTEALKAEIGKNETEVKRLQALVPAFERLQRRRETFNKTLSEIDNRLSDIRYQRAAIPQDLTLIEPVRPAMEKPLLTPKKMILVLMLSGAVGGGTLLLLVLLDLFFGRVRDLRELTFYSELNPLGALPPDDVKFKSEADEKRVLDGIYYRFRPGIDASRILFVGRLPGGKYSRRLRDALNWNCAMCGKRVLHVEFVVSRDFEVTDDMEPLGGLVMGRNSAFFPVNDVSRLSPSELTLLESDVKSLAKKYDLFVLGRRQPLSDDSIFFEQMAHFCDIIELFVGKRRTPRHCLRRAIERQKASAKAMYVVLTGEKNWRAIRGGIK
jgi:predicted  nucleic acid-binding Zn-ribbon protein